MVFGLSIPNCYMDSALAWHRHRDVQIVVVVTVEYWHQKDAGMGSSVNEAGNTVYILRTLFFDTLKMICGIMRRNLTDIDLILCLHE